MPSPKVKPLFSETTLITEIKKGNRDAFEIIFHQYHPALIRFAKRQLRADELVDDVVQDVFVNLWVKRDTLLPEASLKGFLFTCLKNRILNAIRTQKNIILKHSRFVDQSVFTAKTTENEVFASEYDLELAHMIANIPQSKRRVFELSIQGFKNKEISRQVNLSTNTIKMYLSEIRRGFKSSLQHQK